MRKLQLSHCLSFEFESECLGLGYYPPPDRGIEATVLAEERLVGVVSPGHRLACQKRATFDDFVQGPLVLLSRGPWPGQSQSNGAASSVIEMASVEDVLSTIRLGDSAAVLPDHAVCWQRHRDLVRITLRSFPFAVRKIAFWQPRNGCRCYAVAAFIELARRIRYECDPR